MIVIARDSDLEPLTPMLRALNDLHAAQVPGWYHSDGLDAEITSVLAEALAEGAQILMYLTERTPRGYLLWKPNRPSLPALQTPRRLAVLEHIYVEPIWRRRGLGHRLVQRFEAEIAREGYDGWRTSVHNFNAGSQALMQSMGAEAAVTTFVKGTLLRQETARIKPLVRR